MCAKKTISQADLQSHLDHQIAFLERSASSFDEGFEGEASRLAVTIRVLVHDTAKSYSLLSQLKMKGMNFFDSAFEYDPDNLAPHEGLVFLAGIPPTRYVAMLDAMPQSVVKRIDFLDWWERPVFVDNQKRKLSRKQLILTSANQDGGAHVDPKLDEVYADLSERTTLGLLTATGTEKSAIKGPQKAAIRQIAHEILKTIKPNYAKTPQHSEGVFWGGWSISRESTPKPTHSQALMRKTKVGKNAPCPCGSSKKYKHCCGKAVPF